MMNSHLVLPLGEFNVLFNIKLAFGHLGDQRLESRNQLPVWLK